MIVPACRYPNETGPYYLSLYFDNSIKYVEKCTRLDKEEDCKIDKDFLNIL